MELRCKHCGHVSETAVVKSTPQGAAFVCAACGGVTWLADLYTAQGAGDATKRSEVEPLDASMLTGALAVTAAGTGLSRAASAERSAAATEGGAAGTRVKRPTVAPKRPLFGPERRQAIAGVEALWGEVEKAFANRAAHDRFLQACTSSDVLDYAAWRYNDWQYRNGEHEEAGRALSRIVTTAMAQLAPRDERVAVGREGFRWQVWAALTFAALALALASNWVSQSLRGVVIE